MHSDITFIASDLLAAEKVQNILRESPANCQVVLSNTQDLEEVSRSQVAQGAKVLICLRHVCKNRAPERGCPRNYGGSAGGGRYGRSAGGI